MTDTLDDEDRRLFRQAVKGAKPLRIDKAYQKRKPKHPARLKRQAELASEADNDFMLSDHVTETTTAETKLEFHRSGVKLRTLKQLRLGKMPCEAELDLHGSTIEQARSQTVGFIHYAMQNQLRVVRIIHGKGYRAGVTHPVLKNKINTWLPQLDNVLAFCSAQTRDGGTGAVYVLLKTKTIV